LGSKQKLHPGALPQLLGYRLRLAQQAVFRDFAASVQGLSPGRVGLLITIDANPGITQSRLAESAERDRSNHGGRARPAGSARPDRAAAAARTGAPTASG